MRKDTFIILFVFFFLANNRLAAQNTIYVSMLGDDRYAGSFDKPLKSLQTAVDMAAHLDSDAQIFLREGVYRLEQPVMITNPKGHRLLIAPYRHERVVISGAVELRNLQWKHEHGNIFKAKVHAFDSSDMLWVNGQLKHLARYPNFDSTAIRFNGTASDAISPERVRLWKNPQGGFLHAMHQADWGDFHYQFTGKDSQGNLQMKGGWQNNRPDALSKQNRMVENIFEELDAPDEWYLDRSSNYLYYIPRQHEDLQHAAIELSHLKTLIRISGSSISPARFISITGIEFTGTSRTFMDTYEPLLRSDWCINRSAVVYMERAADCTISDCYFHSLGGNAVMLSRYNKHVTISDSHFTDIGASAICVIGDTSAVRSPTFQYDRYVPFHQIDRTPGPKTDSYPSDCYIEGNLIHHIGLYEKQVAGVELSMCQYIRVSHNSIYDVPRAAINVSEGTWGGHVIEYNDLFDTVKETGDHGSFNSWGRDRYWHPNRQTMDSIVSECPQLVLADAMATTIIRDNRIRCDRGWDIDLDDGSSNYHIYNNLCLQGGIKLREGFHRVVDHNILVNSTFHPHVWFHNSGDVFTGNIVMRPYQPVGISEWGSLVDDNIFTDSLSLQKAREKGIDTHSIVDTTPYTYPSSDEFGVTSSELKAIAKRPELPAIVYQTSVRRDDIYSWEGFDIKDLTTEGERSATGMDAVRGVYVIAMTDSYSPLKDELRANDVILKVNGKDIHNVRQLIDSTKERDSLTSITIFRNQHQKEINTNKK